MLSLVLQITFASVIFIFITHYLINFFKDNLTVPKVKDLVNAPSRRYETMYDIIGQNNLNFEDNSNISTPIHSLPTVDDETIPSQYLPTHSTHYKNDNNDNIMHNDNNLTSPKYER